MRLPEATQSASIWARISDAISVESPERLRPGHLSSIELTHHEVDVLLRYARDYIDAQADAPNFPWSEAPRPFRVIDPVVIDALHEILVSPLERDNARGQAREAARVALGLRLQTDKFVFDGLHDIYGPTHLNGASVFYNGHTTSASMSLFPMLGALGLRDAAFRRSSYSGDPGATSLFNTMLAERMKSAAKFDATADLVNRLLTSPSPTIVINGGPLVKKGLPQLVLDRIARGEIRFVLHNAADIEAMRSLPVPAVIIDVANSIPKEIEARVIGEQMALHASAGALSYLNVPLLDSHCIIKGAGLIGGSIIRGLIGFGYDHNRIVVVDPDERARDAAINRGGCRNTFSAIPDWVAGAPHGVLIEATNTVGVSGEDVEKLPHRCLVLSTSSGGVGVDIASMQKKLPDTNTLGQRLGAFSSHTLNATNVFHTLNMAGPGVDTQRVMIGNVRLDNDGVSRAYPVNLVDPVGQQRLVTSPMLAIAVCEIKNIDTPGLYGISDGGVRLLEGGIGAERSGSLIRALTPVRLHKAVEGLASHGPQARLYDI